MRAAVWHGRNDVRVETVPEPRVGFVWAPGFWEWRDHAHVWVPGRWMGERRGYRAGKFAEL